ncbi:MAG TPA: glutamine amidotransferase [Pirellulaceae bacterium]|nr:glutamine amidotransferase [Pirellulaceae bacterium]HMO93732.1 glutamine amidotransferase [Pirellulaceae bacterium]HMP69765.1 glutamine amidotransferase [Pirellulaceae bacterium]
MTRTHLFPGLWNAAEWWPAVLILCLLLGVGLVWSYRNAKLSNGLKGLLVLLKLMGFVLLSICLLEPMRSESRPKSGANTLVLAVDNSQSMNVRDLATNRSRADVARDLLLKNNDWFTKLETEFDLRTYLFGSRLDSVSDFEGFDATEASTSLRSTLETLTQRYHAHPMAGVVLITDGISTETFEADVDWQAMPPIYPVAVGDNALLHDVRIVRSTASESNFETAPISLAVEIETSGFAGNSVEVQLLNEDSVLIDRRTVRNVKDNQPFAVRFDVKPEKQGLDLYRVKAFVAGNEQFADSSEATFVNNEHQLLIDRKRGPYRVLYVTGRPNWEFKFLRRALDDDDELNLVGLIRIAKREPKFTFRSQFGESSNPLFRGFGNQDDEETERYDQAVFLRVGIDEESQLRNGFPNSAEELFAYHAVILDDVEADFFTQDQQTLLQQFVSSRGGSLLMLGGQESFVNGKYDRTSIGEMLPVYIDRFIPGGHDAGYRLELTREGWVEPWIRVRKTEAEEEERLANMPTFKTMNYVNTIKPGASVLATVSNRQGERLPAIVEQRFGQGRAAALLLGDYWRWHALNDQANDDLMIAWRQFARWLVSNVPRRVEVQVDRQDANEAVEIKVRARDELYQPIDSATVNATISLPNGDILELPCEPSRTIAGEYGLTYLPRQAGLHRVNVNVRDHQQELISEEQTGFISQPESIEFAQVAVNRELLELIAEKTGGEVIDADRLNRFVNSLGNRKIPFTEEHIYPWWHQWSLFLAALACLIAEWGLRRWKGLA